MTKRRQAKGWAAYPEGGGFLALLERFVDAHERQAEALERLARLKPRRPVVQSDPQAEKIPVSETDRAQARALARRLGLAVKDR